MTDFLWGVLTGLPAGALIALLTLAAYFVYIM